MSELGCFLTHCCQVADGLHYLVREPRSREGSAATGSTSEDGEIDRPAPLLFFLHGAGERGNIDGSELNAVQKHGPWKRPGSGPFLIVAPQCPKNHVWPAFVDELRKVLDDVQQSFPFDPDRVYVTGLSLGGFGTWALVTKFPHLKSGSSEFVKS